MLSNLGQIQIITLGTVSYKQHPSSSLRGGAVTSGLLRWRAPAYIGRGGRWAGDLRPSRDKGTFLTGSYRTSSAND